MDQKTLNYLRLIVPGSIFLMAAVILGAITKLFKIDVPDTDFLMKSLAVLVIGAVYRFTPFRTWVNRSYHNRINENIRSRMVAIAGQVDDRDRFTWKKVRRVFYDIVDHDESLKVKSERVMFNGLIWTSFADVTAISTLFLGYSIILSMSDVFRADYAAVTFFVLGVVGYVGSIKTTERHIELGDDQLDLMEEKYPSEIAQRISAIA